MRHQMKLFEEPFASIKTGKKIVEVRLNDEKRQKVRIGDTIEFTKIPQKEEKILVKVTGLQAYPTFQDMYENISPKDLDTNNDSIQDMIESTYEIYTVEQEKAYGTLAIKIQLLE